MSLISNIRFIGRSSNLFVDNFMCPLFFQKSSRSLSFQRMSQAVEDPIVHCLIRSFPSDRVPGRCPRAGMSYKTVVWIIGRDRAIFGAHNSFLLHAFLTT